MTIMMPICKFQDVSEHDMDMLFLEEFVISKDFLSQVEETKIYNEVMGSDHCPVGLTIKD